MPVSKHFVWKLWILSCFLFHPQLFGLLNESVDQKFNVQDYRRRLDRIKGEISSLRSSLQNIPKYESSPSTSEPLFLNKVSAREVMKLNSPKKKPVESNTYPSRNPEGKSLKGFYVLPFVGMQSSTNLDWHYATGAPLEIDFKNGLSTGLLLGYNWYDIFAEFLISYQRNDLKGTNPSFNIIGEIEGLGFHLSSGGRINFNESFSGIAGIGVGGIRQKLDLSWSGYPIGDTDFLFSSNVFLGIEFMPTEHLVLGLRYRWVLIDEMDLFSKRYLNSLELSGGYLF